MSKLCRASFLLYRRQILQENIRLEALDEIYKIYTVFKFSDFLRFSKGNSPIFQKLISEKFEKVGN